ncbi:MAG TPA: Fe-S cluster assembly protein SufD [Candidatus Sulfopaludibacter sp.]|jgi:Fe-S cluster assembly protein SufD|nr:Fe-S cluster assembly protein SufD [Candidatus Sulfopaludibacter sp.]
MTAVSEQTGAWLAAFTEQKAAAAPWLQKFRETAFQRFAETGFPNTHNEEWLFTNVAPIARSSFRVVADERVERLPKPAVRGQESDLEAHLGRYADSKANPFVALNSAFVGDVTVLKVPAGAVIAEPIEILHDAQEGTASHPRILILVGANAQCTIVETYTSGGASFTNAVTEIVAGENSVIDHYKVQRESLDAFHVATMQVQVGRSANFSSHSISLGGSLVRNDANAVLSEGSHASLNGLYIVTGKQHVDNHTSIDHAKPHATSHELYKGILDGTAAAVFNGRIIVRVDAQKTDSKQTNKNLVLSDNAVIHTKPELQIHADDVRCTHGATIGQLDTEAMFYLQSRGIGKKEARALLTHAFAQDIIDRVKVQSVKRDLEHFLGEKLHEHAE